MASITLACGCFSSVHTSWCIVAPFTFLGWRFKDSTQGDLWIRVNVLKVASKELLSHFHSLFLWNWICSMQPTGHAVVVEWGTIGERAAALIKNCWILTGSHRSSCIQVEGFELLCSTCYVVHCCKIEKKGCEVLGVCSIPSIGKLWNSLLPLILFFSADFLKPTGHACLHNFWWEQRVRNMISKYFVCMKIQYSISYYLWLRFDYLWRYLRVITGSLSTFCMWHPLVAKFCNLLSK